MLELRELLYCPVDRIVSCSSMGKLRLCEARGGWWRREGGDPGNSMRRDFYEALVQCRDPTVVVVGGRLGYYLK